ncbi:MAG: 2-amino-4-hydroxy-6-hydroxymethyldihydropteridine diphosphokinase, partial [Spirochaetales bacterium]
PWGYADQGRFLNCVFEMSTPLAPESFLALLLSTEKKLKRKRTIPNGPRTIDLDILFYDDLVTASERIAIPHPRLHERMFVLRPFCDLAPDHVHPVFGLPCSRILEDRKKKHGEAEPPEFPQSFWQAG